MNRRWHRFWHGHDPKWRAYGYDFIDVLRHCCLCHPRDEHKWCDSEAAAEPGAGL